MSDFPLLRASLEPSLANLSPGDLGQLVASIYGPGATAEDVEGLFDDIGRGLSGAARGIGSFAQQAAPVVGRILPSVASGAAGGAGFGPWGALIGAGAGLTSGILQQTGNKTAAKIGGAIHDVGGLVSTVRGGGAAGGLGSLASLATGALGHTPAGQGALGSMQAAARGMASGAGAGGGANMLLGLLARPELFKALTATLLGNAGRRDVTVGQQSVPVSQMLATLANVAGRAAHEAAEFEENAEATPEYAAEAAEVLGIDPEDAEGRADAMLTLLALAQPVWWNRPSTPVNVSVNTTDGSFFAGGERGFEAAEFDGDSWTEDTGSWTMPEHHGDAGWTEDWSTELTEDALYASEQFEEFELSDV